MHVVLAEMPETDVFMPRATTADVECDDGSSSLTVDWIKELLEISCGGPTQVSVDLGGTDSL